MAESVLIKVACNDGRDKKIEANLFKIDGFEESFGVHVSDEISMDFEALYDVTELSTGMAVCKGKASVAAAKKFAKERMLKHKDKWPSIKSDSITMLIEAGYKFPLNS